MTERTERTDQTERANQTERAQAPAAACERGRSLRVAAWLALLLGFVYLLSYSGVLHAVDEQSALAVAETFLLGQGWHVNQMEWDQARTPPQNIAGVDGNLYSKKGVGVSLLALLPLWLGKQLAGVGAVRLVLLAALPVTVLAALAFFGAGLTLGYPRRAALLGGLALGLATPLWPYARTLFSEALAACGMAIALWGMIAFRRTALPKRGTRWLWVAGAGLAVLILAKSSNAVAVAVFAVYLLVVWLGERRQELTVRTWLAQVVAFGAPLGLAILATVGYNYVRFHTLFSFPLEPDEQFNTPLRLGLAGLLFSSGKGIFWYMPLLWLAPFFVGRWREARRLPDFILALGAAAAIILFYATWFDWPGGRAWGPRMIVPAVPALALLAYPAFAWLLDAPRWGAGRIAAWGVLAWSCAVQFPGVLVNFERQEMLDMQAGATADGLLWQPALAPWLTYWQRIGTAAIDPWWAQAYLATLPTWLPAVLAAFVVLAGGAVVWSGVRLWRMKPAGIWLGVGFVLLAAAAALLLAAATPDPRWDERSAVREDNAALLDLVHATAAPGDLVLLDLTASSDHQRRTGLWLDRGRLPPYLGWQRKEEMVGAAGERLRQWLQPYRRVWLALQATGDGDPASTTERWLDGWAFPGRRGWLGSQRYVEYLLPTPDAETRRITGPISFGDSAMLAQYALIRNDLTPGYLVELAWTSAPPEDVRYSLQALDAAGRLVAQVDGTPGRIATPAGPLDRIGLSVPSYVPVSVILKLYGVADGVPLPVTPPGANDPQEFLPLEVVATAG
jgi:hypothetical protein